MRSSLCRLLVALVAASAVMFSGMAAVHAQGQAGNQQQASSGDGVVRPTACAGLDQTGAPGEVVTLDGRCSTNPYGKWYQLEYRWTQPAGQQITLSDVTRGDPTFTVPAGTPAGTVYTFHLTVTDREGQSDADTVQVTVTDGATATPPTACAGPDLSGEPGETVTLQGTCSTNPHGQWWRLAHSWTQPGGQSLAMSGLTTAKPTFTVPADAAPGAVYSFTLTVTDKDGETDSDTMTVTVVPPPPAAEGQIDDVVVEADGSLDVDAASAFTGTVDTYEATSSDPSVATASVANSTVTVAGVWAGRAQITVSASNGGGTASQSFYVIVAPRTSRSTGEPGASGQSSGLAAPERVVPTWLPRKLVLKWKAVDGASNYRVQWKSGSQEYDSTRQTDVTGLEHTVDFVAAITTTGGFAARVAALDGGSPAQPGAWVELSAPTSTVRISDPDLNPDPSPGSYQCNKVGISGSCEGSSFGGPRNVYNTLRFKLTFDPPITEPAKLFYAFQPSSAEYGEDWVYHASTSLLKDGVVRQAIRDDPSFPDHEVERPDPNSPGRFERVMRPVPVSKWDITENAIARAGGALETATLGVSIIGDRIPEEFETVVLKLWAGRGALPTADGATSTIVDDDELPEIVVGNVNARSDADDGMTAASFVEGTRVFGAGSVQTKSVSFPVRLTGAYGEPVTVNYRWQVEAGLKDPVPVGVGCPAGNGGYQHECFEAGYAARRTGGSAAGTDYTALPRDNPGGTVTFSGQQHDLDQMISVVISEDDLEEGDEKIVVLFSEATGATLRGANIGVGTVNLVTHLLIVDDDAPVATPTVTIEPGPPVSPGNDATFTVTRTGTGVALSSALTVNLDVDITEGYRAVAPSRSALPSSVTIPANANSATVTVFTRQNPAGSDPVGEVTVTLQPDTPPGTTPAVYEIGNPSEATVQVGHHEVWVSSDTVTVGEGQTTTYSVSLTLKPHREVVVTPISNDAKIRITGPHDSSKIARLTPTVLKFTPQNWDTPQTVTITGISDGEVVGQRTANIHHAVDGYGAVTSARTVKLVVTDNRETVPEVSVARNGPESIDEGGTASFTVTSDTAAPAGGLTVRVGAKQKGEFAVTSVRAVTIPTGQTTAAIAWVTIDDNLDEVDGSVTAVVLDDDADELRYRPGRTMLSVVARDEFGIVILDADGNPTYTQVEVNSQDTVAVLDNDVRGVTLTPPAVSVGENGLTTTYTVKLKTQPTATVIIRPYSTNLGAATLSYTSTVSALRLATGVPAADGLEFTTDNWNVGQQVTVTGVNDDDVNEGGSRSATIRHPLEGGDYGRHIETGDPEQEDPPGFVRFPVAALPVTVTDDDGTGTTLSNISILGNMAVTEGTAAEFTLVANPAPTADLGVTVKVTQNGDFVASGDLGDKTVTITAGQTMATLSVPTIDDAVDEPNGWVKAVIQDGTGYTTGNVLKEQARTINDNDERGVVVDPTSVTVEENDTVTYTVKLSSQPTADVTITPTSSNTSIAMVSGALTFTAGNWNTAQSVTVTGADDPIVNSGGQRSTTITHTVIGGDYGTHSVTASDVSVTVTDDDTLPPPQPNNAPSFDDGDTASRSIAENAGAGTDATARNVGTALTATDADPGDTLTYSLTGTDAASFAIGAGNGQISTLTTVNYDREAKSNYAVTVEVSDGRGGDDSIAVTINLTNVSEPPLEPTGLSASAQSSSSISVSATAPGNSGRPAITTYQAQYRVNGTNNAFTAAGFSSPTPSAVISGLSPSTTYEIQMRANNADGAGAWSDSATATTSAASTLPSVSISANNASVVEGGTAVFTLTANPAPTSDLSVEVAVRFTNHQSDTVYSASISPSTGTGVLGVPTRADDNIDQDSYSIDATVSSGSGYTVGTPSSASVAVDDNDTRGITLSKSEVTVTEDGGIQTYTLTLRSEPSRTVTITPASDDTSVATVSGALTFTGGNNGNWATPQTVTVTGVNDNIDNAGDQRSTTITHTVTGGDYEDHSVDAGVVSVTVTDDDIGGGFTVSKDTLRFSENGGSDTYTIKLSAQPTGNVDVTPGSDVNADSPDAISLSGRMTFTPENWNVAQEVTVTGVNDDIVNAGGQRTAAVVYTVLPAAGTNYLVSSTSGNVAVTVTDDDTRGITVSETSVTPGENGGTDTYTIKLNSEPTGGDVTITPSSGNTGVATVSGALTFTAGTWSTPQTVTVTGVDDNVVSARSTTISHAVSGGDYGSVTASSVQVSLVEDDSRGVTLSLGALSVREDGGISSYTVKLASQPTGTVTVTPTSSDTSAATVSEALTFTGGELGNWNTAQTVTVTGVDDDIDNPNNRRTVTVTHLVAGADYASVDAPGVTVTVDDNDTVAALGAPQRVVPTWLPGKLVLKWQPVSDAASYRVEWKSGDEEFGDTERTTEVTETDATVTLPASLDGFEARVAALDGTSVRGPWSDVVAAPTSTVTISGDFESNEGSSKRVSQVLRFRVTFDGPITEPVKLFYSFVPTGTAATYGEDFVYYRTASNLNPGVVYDALVAAGLPDHVTVQGSPPQRVTVKVPVSKWDITEETIARAGGPLTSTNIGVTINGDIGWEHNENVELRLWAARGAVLGSTVTATSTIIDDDPVPMIEVGDATSDASVPAATWAEGPERYVELPVRLVGGSESDVGVHWEISGDSTARAFVQSDTTIDPANPYDFRVGEDTSQSLANGTMTFSGSLNPNPFGQKQVLRIWLFDDGVAEGDETIVVRFHSAWSGAQIRHNSGGSLERSLVIVDNDASDTTPSVTITAGDPIAVGETATFTVTRAGATMAALADALTVNVRASVSEGYLADGQTLPSTVTIEAGEASKTVEIRTKVPPTDSEPPSTNTGPYPDANTPVPRVGLVTVTLQAADPPSGSDPLAYQRGSPHSATVRVGHHEVAVSTSTLRIAEADDPGTTGHDGAAAYSVVLGTQPTGNVTITPSASPDGVVTLSQSSLTFTAENWATPQYITVAAVNDDIANEGGERTVTITNAVAGYTHIVNGATVDITAPSIEVTVLDDDGGTPTTPALPVVTIARSGPESITEGGTASFTVTRSAAEGSTDPLDTSSALTVSVGWKQKGEFGAGGALSGKSDVVIPANMTTVTYLVATDDDDRDEVDGSITAVVLDDENDYGYQPGKEPATTRSGRQLQVNSQDTVTVLDDDVRGVTVEPVSVSVGEDGGTATYTLVLDTQPTADVTIRPYSDDLTAATLSYVSTVAYRGPPEPAVDPGLRFTPDNWDTPQTVTITGVNDDVENEGGVRSVTIRNALSGGDYGQNVHTPSAEEPTTPAGAFTVDRVQVAVVDDDGTGPVQPSISIAAVTSPVTEGTVATFRLTASPAPTANLAVTVGISQTGDFAPDGQIGTRQVTIGANSATVDILVSTVNDQVTEGGGSVTTMVQTGTGYTVGAPSSATVDVNDDDIAGFTVSESTLTIAENGGQATYTIKLDTQPTGNVQVVPRRSNEAISLSGRMTFTPGNWSRPQMVTVTGVNDDIDNADDKRTATITYLVEPAADTSYPVSNTSGNVTVTVTDDDTRGITVSKSQVTVAENGGTATYTINLNTEPTDTVTIGRQIITMSRSINRPMVTDALTFTAQNWSEPQMVTVTGVDDDVDNTDDRGTWGIRHSASGGDYDLLTFGTSGVTVTVTDDDTRGITVSKTSVAPGENGGEETYTVVLHTAPYEDVTITPVSVDTDVATVSTASVDNTLTFTGGNWNTPQTITVTGVDDDFERARSTTVTHTVTGGDYGEPNDVPARAVQVNLVEDDMRGVGLSRTSFSVGENGASSTYTVVLDSQPTGPVMITPSSDDETVATVSEALTFTEENWDMSQEVTVTGVNDDIDNSDADGMNDHRMATITHTVSGGDYGSETVDSVSVTVTDDDTRGVSVTAIPGPGLTVDENGGTAEYTVVLDSQPTENVTVTLSSSGADQGAATAGPASLTFTPMNWSTAQKVTVTGVNDNIDNSNTDGTDDHRTLQINHAVMSSGDYQAVPGARSVEITVTDDDDRGIGVSQTSRSVDEDGTGTTATYEVWLLTQPTGPVMIRPMSDDTTVATVSGALTFTTSQWGHANRKTVTITGVNDDIDNSEPGGTANDFRTSTISHSASGGDYAAFSPPPETNVTVTVNDRSRNDVRGITVSQTGVTVHEPDAGTTTATYTVYLHTQPTGNVVITPSVDSVATLSPVSHTFTPSQWGPGNAKTFTVTVVNDDIDNAGDQRSATITHTVTGGDYGSTSARAVTVTAVDDDTRGVTVSKSTVTVNEAGADTTETYTVKLDTEPTGGNVTVTPSSGDTGVATVSGALTFTASNWSRAQTVTVTGVNDDIDNANNRRSTTITHTVTGGDYEAYTPPSATNVSVTVDDDDEPVVKIEAVSGSVTEGTDAVFRLTATPAPWANLAVSLRTVVTDDVLLHQGNTNVPPYMNDVTTTNGTVTIPGWQAGGSRDVRTFDHSVATNNDQVDEGNGSVAATLTQPAAGAVYTLGTPTEAMVTVNDDDLWRGLSITSRSVSESAGEVSVTVTATGLTTRHFTCWADTASATTTVADNDYSGLGNSLTDGQTLSFVDSPVGSLTVTVTGDRVDEDNEALSIRCKRADDVGGSAQGTLTIVDDDTRGFRITNTAGHPLSTLRVREDSTFKYRIRLTSQPAAGSVTITPSISDVSVATVSAGSLTFRADNWNTDQEVTVTAPEDNDDTLHERATISHVTAASGTGNDYASLNAPSLPLITPDDDIGDLLRHDLSGLDEDDPFPASTRFSLALAWPIDTDTGRDEYDVETMWTSLPLPDNLETEYPEIGPDTAVLCWSEVGTNYMRVAGLPPGKGVALVTPDGGLQGVTQVSTSVPSLDRDTVIVLRLSVRKGTTPRENYECSPLGLKVIDVELAVKAADPGFARQTVLVRREGSIPVQRIAQAGSLKPLVLSDYFGPSPGAYTYRVEPQGVSNPSVVQIDIVDDYALITGKANGYATVVVSASADRPDGGQDTVTQTFRVEVGTQSGNPPPPVEVPNSNAVGNSHGSGQGAGDGEGVTPKDEVVRPTACAGPDQTGAPGQQVTLQGRCSTNPYGPWHRMAHRWTQPASQNIVLSDAARGDPSFTVPAGTPAGTVFEFHLTVTDQEGQSDTDIVLVTITSSPTATPPTACAGPDLSANPGEQVTLQGNCSTNPHGQWWRMAHLWTQPSGQGLTLSDTGVAKPTFTVPNNAVPGTVYTFTLTVTDKDGETDSDTMTVTIVPG